MENGPNTAQRDSNTRTFTFGYLRSQMRQQ